MGTESAVNAVSAAGAVSTGTGTWKSAIAMGLESASVLAGRRPKARNVAPNMSARLLVREHDNILNTNTEVGGIDRSSRNQ